MPRSRNLPAELETDPKKVLKLVVGLPDVSVLGVNISGAVVDLHVEKLAELVCCPSCGAKARLKGWREVVLVDLPAFGKPTRLHWHKRRWCCAEPDCDSRSRKAVTEWIDGRSEEWRQGIERATLDLSGTYKAVFDTTLADAHPGG